jgi:hypothetical protein
MPIIIHEIVITTNIEKNTASAGNSAADAGNVSVEEVVKQAVEKVMEILDEKKQR